MEEKLRTVDVLIDARALHPTLGPVHLRGIATAIVTTAAEAKPPEVKPGSTRTR
jgi:hypothetical protein